METAEWSVEDESREGDVVVVSNADIDPRTVVVHLHNTPGVGGKKGGREEGREGRRREGRKKG